jgi:hypothetical protein
MASSSILSEPAYSGMNTPRRLFLGLDRKLPRSSSSCPDSIRMTAAKFGLTVIANTVIDNATLLGGGPTYSLFRKSRHEAATAANHCVLAPAYMASTCFLKSAMSS